MRHQLFQFFVFSEQENNWRLHARIVDRTTISASQQLRITAHFLLSLLRFRCRSQSLFAAPAHGFGWRRFTEWETTAQPSASTKSLPQPRPPADRSSLRRENVQRSTSNAKR